MNDTPDEIARVRRALETTVREAAAAGARDAFRVQTDFIGRMNDAFMEIMSEYDDETEAFPPGEGRDDAVEALTSLAGLCIGLVALLRAEDA